MLIYSNEKSVLIHNWVMLESGRFYEFSVSTYQICICFIMSFIRHEVDRAYTYQHWLSTIELIYYGVIVRKQNKTKQTKKNKTKQNKNHVSLIAAFKSHRVLFPVRNRRV